MSKRWKIILAFLFLVIATFGSIIFMQQRYTTILQGGGEYQWPVTLERQINWAPGDKLMVHFLGTQAMWDGKRQPIVGKPIYVVLGVEPSGIVYIKNATDQKPKGELYIIANVKESVGGTVEFEIPYMQVAMNLDEINAAFYSGQYKGVLLATMKIKDGHAVITGVYTKGVSLEEAIPNLNADMTKGEAQLLTGAPLDEAMAKLLSAPEEKKAPTVIAPVIKVGAENP